MGKGEIALEALVAVHGGDGWRLTITNQRTVLERVSGKGVKGSFCPTQRRLLSMCGGGDRD
jgi:hypothetical protein